MSTNKTKEISKEEITESEALVEKKFKINTINKRINSLQQFNIFLLSKEYMDGVIIILKKDKFISEK